MPGTLGRHWWIVFLLVTLVLAAPLTAENPTVVIDTSLGRIVVELYREQAPKTVENFLVYVNSGHYEGTIFHRVFSQELIQGGGFDQHLKERPNRAPVQNEADNGLSNLRGTIAMARSAQPHSARSQFFINLRNHPMLDHRAKTPRDWGYTVFGRVVAGLEVADSISDVPSRVRGGHQNLPIIPVVINRISVQ